MKRTIIEFQQSDRNIVLFSDENEKLIGVNFWQGMGDMTIADSFLLPDFSLDMKSFIGKPLSITIEFIDVIDRLIWESIEPKQTYLPNAQRHLICMALKFYVETYEKFNTDGESYLPFDMNVLKALMTYPIWVDISEQEKEEFTARHGYDFPNFK